MDFPFSIFLKRKDEERMSHWLKNVRLETGYKRESGRVSGTITDLHHLYIDRWKNYKDRQCKRAYFR